jgi:hypothetical protein
MSAAEWTFLRSRGADVEYVVGEGPCVCRYRCWHYGTIGKRRQCPQVVFGPVYQLYLLDTYV